MVMSVYVTEEEQLEAMRNFWRKYGTLISTLLALCMLVFVGYKYWYWHQEKVTANASMAYENMMTAFSKENPNATKAYANQLIQDYSRTVYADVAKMMLAKVSVDANPDMAKTLLQNVIDSSGLRALKELATLRLARLYKAEKAYDKALALLAKVEDTQYLPVVNELKGDIYVAQGQLQKAILLYKEAMSDVRPRGLGNFLEMKTNALAYTTEALSTLIATPSAA
jgi:predicted negative regulator of RcsB-dependent stress response